MAPIDGNTKIGIDSGKFFYDVDKDGKKNAGEKNVSKEVQEILNSLSSSGVDIANHTLKEILDSIKEMDTKIPRSATDEEAVKKHVVKLQEIAAKLEEAIKQYETLADDSAKSEEAGEMKKLIDALKQEAKQIHENAKKYGAETGKSKTTFKQLTAKLQKSGVDVKSDSTKEPLPDKTPNPNDRPQQQQKAAGGTYQQPAGGFRFSSGYGTGGLGKFGSFDMDAYLNSSFIDDSIISGWDSINKNQAKQKKMMMLFFYFAKMAMSGDMGAIYRFMHFITYIISKSKASDTVLYASKMIELEEQNREALQELLDAKVPGEDGTADEGLSVEFSKIMQKTKATQSSIATSQKLLATTMEEASQVIESVNSLLKSGLDSRGRILRRLTSPS